MKLVIGGYAQGKLKAVLEREKQEKCLVYRAVLPESAQILEALREDKTVVIDDLHEWIKKRMQQGKVPEEEIRDFLASGISCILISDEIGNGIVPADAFEREYRERCGRLLTFLAGEASEVERVICGIVQKLK